jgi:hypothetical protein
MGEDMNFLRIAAAPALAISAMGLSATAIAQEAEEADAMDEEAELDEALKRFGYLSGLAQVCVSEEQKPELEKEVLEIHGSIARLLGVDRAFLYSTSFGYGTSVEVELDDCAEVLKTYAERTKKYREGKETD